MKFEAAWADPKWSKLRQRSPGDGDEFVGVSCIGLGWHRYQEKKIYFFKICRFCCEVSLCLPRSALLLRPCLLRGYLSAMTKQIMCEGGFRWRRDFYPCPRASSTLQR